MPQGLNDSPRYDRLKSYEWNFENAPTESPQVDIPTREGLWTYCGLPINSPLGIAAGPLLNGNWVRYYASLEFDVLTYKTVRSRPRECYELPNLLPVHADMMSGDEDHVSASDEWQGSWAVSFGMPSKAPEFWMEDVRQTKEKLSAGQILIVSVVGTMQPGWGIEELANDYAVCAKKAFESKADCVEMNFSCPNVCSEDGQLFQSPEEAELVAKTVRRTVDSTSPLLVKIGHLQDVAILVELLCRLDKVVNAIVTTNSVASQVTESDGSILFDGQQRGICGRATRDASIQQVAQCRSIIEKQNLNLDVIGVGGIESADHVQQYLNAGASSVQLATAPMIDPNIGIEIRKSLIAKQKDSGS
ncbi:hypothetical protein N8590_01730 [bacterium]|jgi:dihydroorotate dehydrogenase (NAD+) catalytic subunit|nr:hypothetical protein [Planctomicrobium sp.]MDA7527688.1 hypothetical protein [bacterium]MDB4802481.1 hypothetical protein [bacterium]